MTARALPQPPAPPAFRGDLGSDAEQGARYFSSIRDLLGELPAKPDRSTVEQAAAEALLAAGRRTREHILGRHGEAIYDQLTDGGSRLLRASELVYAAAERFPGLVPNRAEIRAERGRPQKDKDGWEIDQGIFLERVLASPRIGSHLVHAMSQPTAAALERLDELQNAGSVDLGPVRVDREGRVGLVTLQNLSCLNAEDDVSVGALETAVDLVLLDPTLEVGVLRGAPAVVHPKYAGRRVFSAGINLTDLYYGRISFVEFMIERELGALGKMYRGHGLGEAAAGDLAERREKPWIAVVESFAIGGGCQILLVVDHVIAARDSYFNLPARKEGIVPGCASMRLPSFVGDRLSRQAIFFNRAFPADSPEGRLIADEVVDEAKVDLAIERAASELTSAGLETLRANRKMMRVGQEPLDRFRCYMAAYAREQAFCMYSPALISNLEYQWDARRRKPR